MLRQMLEVMHTRLEFTRINADVCGSDRQRRRRSLSQKCLKASSAAG